MLVPFVDLLDRFKPYRQAFHAAIDRILDHGQIILGPEVEQFESAMASYIGCRYAVGVANGTDALCLAMKSVGIGAGDEVITTPMSYLASTSSITLVGATPVFADVGADLNLDPDTIEKAITPRTRAIVLVHLAGNPAQTMRITDIAKRHGLILIEDCAQAIGATSDGKMVGSFGDFSTFSMHPLKNLGTLGDAGIILTNDVEKFSWFQIARNHGHSSREQCEFWSNNSRLDTIQAAMLNEMLPDLPEFLSLRRKQAERYKEELSGYVSFPASSEQAEQSYNMFMILVEERARLRQHLQECGIETRVHYPIPIHQLRAAETINTTLPRAEYYSERILSLPLGTHLTPTHIDTVIKGIKSFALHNCG